MNYWKVEECCEILDSMRVPITEKDRTEGEYPYYGANGIQDHVAKYIFDDELVLLAEDGGNFGSKTRPIAYRVSGKCWVNNHAHVLKPKNVVNVDYLCYSLMFYDVGDMVNGATRQKLTQAAMRAMLVPARTMSEQLEIVDRITRIFAIIAKKKQQIEELNILTKARFVEMFGNFYLNDKRWPIVGFEDIAEIDGNMTTDYEKYADYPHIGIDSIEKKTGALKGYRTVAEDGVISGKYMFTPDHIIYSKIRPNLNKVALPDFVGLCSADAYPISPKKDKCNRVFLAYDMRSQFFLDYILQYCDRTNLPKVNRKEVAGFKTPLPPIELQEEFADFVKQVDKSKVVLAFIQKQYYDYQYGRRMIYDKLRLFKDRAAV